MLAKYHPKFEDVRIAAGNIKTGAVTYTSTEIFHLVVVYYRKRWKYQCVQLSRFTRFSDSIEERSRINRFYCGSTPYKNEFPFSQRRDVCAAQWIRVVRRPVLVPTRRKGTSFFRSPPVFSLGALDVVYNNAQYSRYMATVIRRGGLRGWKSEDDGDLTNNNIIVRRDRYNNSTYNMNTMFSN